MSTTYAGAGDGRRSMALLWGRQPKGSRGPRPGLRLDEIVAAAVELADAEGIEAVSMRRVAERLGIGTMSLYTYVPGKGELLDLMLDAVYGERARKRSRKRSWRGRLEVVARDQWEFHKRHPWTLYVASGRAVLGPNELDAYETALACVADLDIPARDAVAMVDSLSTYVRGFAREVAEAERAAEATGKSETDWWSEREPTLGEVMTEDRFPASTRLSAAGGFDVPPDSENYNLRFALDDFEFGLQRLLDGFAAFISRAP